MFVFLCVRRLGGGAEEKQPKDQVSKDDLTTFSPLYWHSCLLLEHMRMTAASVVKSNDTVDTEVIFVELVLFLFLWWTRNSFCLYSLLKYIVIMVNYIILNSAGD